MSIFHSYVSLPKGMMILILTDFYFSDIDHRSRHSPLKKLAHCQICLVFDLTPLKNDGLRQLGG